jgi:hypothetical protein
MGKPHTTALHQHVIIRWGDINPSPDYGVSISGVLGGQGSLPVQDLREHARTGRRNMEHDKNHRGQPCREMSYT